MELDGTHQLLSYAYDVNTLGGRVSTVQKKEGTLLFVRKETGIEVNTDKTNYMVMSENQNAGRSHIVESDNISFEKEEAFKYF